MRLVPTLLFIGLAAGLAACGHDGSDSTEPVGPTVDGAVDDDPATLPADDATGAPPAGTLMFEVADGGVRMTGGLTGLDPDATHAMHIHETGDCSAPDFSSAGGHFNPDDAPHGDRAGAGPHHAGDMPNQVADAAGNSRVDRVLDDVTLGSGGADDIIGKAVVVHEKADDYTTQPSGDAGGRIACGVIEAATPAPEYLGPADGDIPDGSGIPDGLDVDEGVEATEGTGAAAETDNPTDVDGT